MTTSDTVTAWGIVVNGCLLPERYNLRRHARVVIQKWNRVMAKDCKVCRVITTTVWTTEA